MWERGLNRTIRPIAKRYLTYFKFHQHVWNCMTSHIKLRAAFVHENLQQHILHAHLSLLQILDESEQNDEHEICLLQQIVSGENDWSSWVSSFCSLTQRECISSQQLKGPTNYEESQEGDKHVPTLHFKKKKFQNKNIRHHHWIYRYLKTHIKCSERAEISFSPLNDRQRIYGPKWLVCLLCAVTARILRALLFTPCFVNQPLSQLSLSMIVTADHRRFLILKCRSISCEGISDSRRWRVDGS